jgi:cytochrome b561
MPRRYHPALVTLHWLIALLIFVAAFFALGTGGEQRGRGGLAVAGFPVLGVHMILGITVLVLLAVRLLIRLRSRHPDWATAGNALLDRIGVFTHWALYFSTFAITITGLILALQTNRLSRVLSPSGTTRTQFPQGQFQPGQFPPPGQSEPGRFPPGGPEGGFRRGGFFLGAFHGLSWIFLLLLIVLHVGAALYHQFVRRDGLLGRMWFGRRFA